MTTRRAFLAGLSCTLLTACGGRNAPEEPQGPPLYPNETPQLRALINKWADHYEVPRALVHRRM